jgi:ribosomal protein L5
MTWTQLRGEDLLLRTGLRNSLELPQLEKVVLHMSLGNYSIKEISILYFFLQSITGLKPSMTFSSKAVLGTGVRRGMLRGCKVTLRGEEALAFLERLNLLYLPKNPKFEGLTFQKEEQKKGNLTFQVTPTLFVDFQGLVTFPRIPSLDVNLRMTKGDPALFLSSLGLPFIYSS